MATSFAGRLALIGFAATALDAAWSGTDLASGLNRALWNVVVLYGLGLVVGYIAGRLMEEMAQNDFERWKGANAPNA